MAETWQSWLGWDTSVVTEITVYCHLFFIPKVLSSWCLPWSHPTGGPAALWYLFYQEKKVFCIRKEENSEISQAICVFIRNTKVYSC